MPESLHRTWTLRMIIRKFFGLEGSVCKIPNLDTGGRNKKQHGVLGAHVMYLESASSKMSFTGMQLWARIVPPVAATPAQPRKLKLLLKKRPQFLVCHCQNLTVPGRARLKLVHSSRLVQRESLVSWWKKVEHCKQSRTHAMMQTTDCRFELSTARVADDQLLVRIHAGKKHQISTLSKQ